MNRTSTSFRKTLSMAFILCLTISIQAQTSSDFAANAEFPDSKTEQIQLRERQAKHFELANGNMKAFISGGSLHYKDASGNWTDISTQLTTSSLLGYALENVTNNLESYFPSKAAANEKGVLIKNNNGFLKMAINPSLDILNSKFETVTSTSFNTPAQLIATHSKISYKSILPGLDNEFEVQPDKVKNGLVLHELPSGVTEGAFLGYSETLKLEEGWKLINSGQTITKTTITRTGITIVDELGSQEFIIPVPDVFEKNNPEISINADGSWDFSFKIETLGNNSYRLTTIVPMNWITDENRVFPIVIDPTITIPGNWGGWLRPPSNLVESNPSGFVFTGISGTDVYHAWTKFDISSITNASVIVDTKLQAYMDYTTNAAGSETINITDVTGALGPYLSYNATAYADLGSGVYTSFNAIGIGTYGYYDLGPGADAHVQQSLIGDEFQVGFASANTTSPITKRFISNQIFLQVEYTNCTGQITMTATPTILSNGFTLGCASDSNGTITTSATGGSGNYSFIFSGSNGYYDTINSPSNLPAGTYFIQVWDDIYTCPDTTTIVIGAPNLNSSATASLYNGFNISCNGGSDGTLSAIPSGTGSYAYSWAGPNGFTSSLATITSLGVGTYNYTISDTQFGCTASGMKTLTQPPLINVSTQLFGNSLCENDSSGSVSAVATGGVGSFTVLWDDPASSATLVVFNIPPGTYMVTVTDGNGCNQTGSQTVGFIFEAPMIDLGEDIGVCEEQGGKIDAGSGFSNYSWSTGESTQSIQVSSLGNYAVTITDNNGCANSDEIAVTELYALPTPNLGPNISTGVTPVTLNPGIFVGYKWSIGPSSPTITVSQSGTYTVTVTDENGCIGTDEVNVKIWANGINQFETSEIQLYPNPVATSLTLDAPSLQGLNLDLNITNAVGQIVYSKEMTVTDKISIDVSNLARGTYIFSLKSEENVWYRTIILD